MPVIWTIEAYRAGERNQVQALVNALDWPNESKRLSYRPLGFLPHLLCLNTLRGLRPQARALLRPPWPDLVISSGVRNEPVCRWIRQQSGGRTRYVHLGKPWAATANFDVLITTPQYRVTDAPGVVQNTLTLNAVTEQTLAQAAADRKSEFSDLPRPHIAVIAGGNSGPFTLGVEAARRFGREASALARESGGSLLVTTSSRTTAAACEALRAAIDVPCFFYSWRQGDQRNPYFGILGSADLCVVSADSIAMLSEAIATGKPVHMFDLGGMRPDTFPRRDFRLGGFLYGILLRWFWRPLSRDITLVHARLLELGLVSWLGDVATAAPTSPQSEPAALDSDMESAVDAVKKLFGEFGVTGAVEQDRPAID
jgi:mitochondrial fission protein ELM1